MTEEVLAQPVLSCSQCGRSFTQSDLVQIAGNWVCSECKPAYLSHVMSTGAAPAARRYAGFGIRFGARFIDGLVQGVVILVVALLMLPGLFRAGVRGANPAVFGAFFSLILVSLLIGAFYEILMLKYRSATLGKMACGLRVIRADGGELGWGVCIGRFFMWNVVCSSIPYVNWVLMIASAIMVGTDAERRGLHDRVCGTRVVYQ